MRWSPSWIRVLCTQGWMSTNARLWFRSDSPMAFQKTEPRRTSPPLKGMVLRPTPGYSSITGDFVQASVADEARPMASLVPPRATPTYSSASRSTVNRASTSSRAKAGLASSEAGLILAIEKKNRRGRWYADKMSKVGRRDAEKVLTIRLMLAALLSVFAMTFWWSSSQAQDEQSCKVQCREQQQACMEFCSEHSNPVECEANCREDHQDCVHVCRS
jgi:hypothetical protein